ncbi:SixA phosphatase family protein [Flavimarina sp. Hel_I_48]|uniref:SixA phosphatase family protein n=1 Tax=Flavimarina sp. Hel_I_48 TaxID=1392488 RepID=UPI0004DF58A7|nr:phosphoglycerate mutase family protein [Flavimarina sp. Hel_I_48]
MRLPIILLLLVLTTLSCENSEKQKSTTYYFIRHAEKERGPNVGSDPLLTEKGMERAKFWANYFEDKNIDAVYSTDTKRTRATAKPTTEKFNLTTLTYDAQDMYNASFKEKTMGKTVLIVGHSNTTPQFVNKILGKEQYEAIDDSEFGIVFKVTLDEEGNSNVEKKTINSWDTL